MAPRSEPPGTLEVPRKGSERRLLQEHLRRNGLKMTRERELILEEVVRLEGHFQPDDLLVRFRRRGMPVSRATIYRALDLLVDVGLVHRETFRGRGALFERAHRVQGHSHHDHLQCNVCGTLFEFHNEEIERLHARQERILESSAVGLLMTDAEGRILLADGVSYAARVLKAHTIFDAATLTGAQLIATGNLHAAVFSNDPDLERTSIEAGYRSGDLVHPLPFAPEFYKQEFASTVADMRNSVKNRANAQSSCAAQFIYWHIEDSDVRWCHVDLAGPAFRSLRATGFGVALLAECVRALG